MITSIAGWGNYPRGQTDLRLLENSAAYRAVAGDPHIIRGNGRSYGDAAFLSSGVTADARAQHQLLEFDKTSGILRAEGGILLGDLLRETVPHGWFLPVTPGTKLPTLAGSVACDVHGKNHHLGGNISSFVDELLLLLPDGTERRCSPALEPDLFWATCGGMGLTGYIREVTLRLRRISSAYLRVRHRKCGNLDEAMQALQEHSGSAEYSVAWIDCLARGKSLGRSILILGDHAGAGELSPKQAGEPYRLHRAPRVSVPVNLPSWTLNSLSIRAFNQRYYHRRLPEQEISHYDPFFYPLDGVGEWNRFYGRRGFVQYQCVLPHETAAEGLRHLLEAFSSSGNASFLAVLKTMGAEAGPLGFPKPGFTLALDIPMKGDELLQLLDRLDEKVVDLGGRIYLAKDARLKAELLPVMYPRLEEWLQVKRSVDPRGVLQSDLSRRLRLG